MPVPDGGPGPSSRPPGGLSIVTALRDRAASLHGSLRSWIAHPGIDEIVVVDVGSRPSLEDLGVLEAPKVVLVSIDEAPPFCPGLGRNVGAEIARSATLLLLEPDLHLRDIDRALEAVAARAGAFATGVPAGSGLSLPGAVLVGRERFARVGGYHEFLPGRAFSHEDLANRLEDDGADHVFFGPAAIEAVPQAEPPRTVRVDRTDPADPFDGLERTPLFEAQRNRILAGLLPWRPGLAELRPRRIGSVDPRLYRCALAPCSTLEQRQRDAASYLAAVLLHRADPDRTIGLTMLDPLFEERSDGYEERARRQHQIDILSRGGAAATGAVPAAPRAPRARRRAKP